MTQDSAPRRSCSRQTCTRDAVCTLTYVYADSTAVIGALSARREPHAYDLCPVHADALTAPRGWRVVRLESPDGWNRDDLDAVVEAVRPDPEPAVRRAPRGASLGAVRPAGPGTGGARVLRDVSYRPGPDERESSDSARPAHATGGDAREARSTRDDSRAARRGAQEVRSTGEDARATREDARPTGENDRTRPAPGVPDRGADEYPGTTDSIAKANPRPSSGGRPAPLPAALRTPHLRRP